MIDDSCLFGFMVLVLGVNQGYPKSVCTFEVHLYVLPFVKSVEPVSSVWDVGDNNCGSVFVVAVLVVVICWVVDVVVVVIGDLVGMFELVFPLVKCPVRELAVV